jgi:hypothetical protein
VRVLQPRDGAGDAVEARQTGRRAQRLVVATQHRAGQHHRLRAACLQSPDRVGQGVDGRRVDARDGVARPGTDRGRQFRCLVGDDATRPAEALDTRPAAIRIFIDWVEWAKGATPGYKLHFFTNPKVTWQRSTFSAVQALGGSSVIVTGAT